MPSFKTVATIAIVSAAVYIGIDRYKTAHGK